MHQSQSAPSGSGFSFRDVRPFEVIFPLIHYVGSFFFSLQFNFSVPGETGHELMSSEAASWALSVCSVWRCELQIEKRLCRFSGCSVFVWDKQTVSDTGFLIYCVGGGFWGTEQRKWSLGSFVCLSVCLPQLKLQYLFLSHVTQFHWNIQMPNLMAPFAASIYCFGPLLYLLLLVALSKCLQRTLLSDLQFAYLTLNSENATIIIVKLRLP